MDILFWLRNILRFIITYLDGLIYTIDAELYDLIVKIASQKIFTDGTINEVAGRVYQLLALIMIFRLIFLFITYIINPDDMLDKTKGYQNVIKKMIITLGLIIITPWAFNQARIVQQLVLEEGIIEYFVFGESSNANVSSGYELMHTIGMLFVTPYKCNSADENGINDGTSQKPCTSVSEERNNVETNLCEHGKWDESINVISSNGDIVCDGTNNTPCNKTCGLGVQDDQGGKEYAKTLFRAAYPTGDKYDLNALMQLGRSSNTTKKVFYAEYKYPLVGTTLIGVFIGYMLVVMCIEMAIRSIKLSFYELIAPIPIVSYIGPKDGKESMLNKWFNQVLKTYADLFTRIAGLEIAVFFIDTLLQNETLIKSNDFFVELFLILGALTFAKKLPDILKDLGVKFDGGSFSLKKSLAPLAPAAGMVSGAIGGMAGNLAAGRQVNQGFMGGIKTAGQAIAGAIGGAARGGMAGLKEKEGMGIKAGMTAGGRGAQNIYNRAGTSFVGRHVAKVQNAVGATTEGERLEQKAKAMETYAGFKKSLKDNADFFGNAIDISRVNAYSKKNPGDADKSYMTSSNSNDIMAAMSGGVKGIKQYYEDLRNSGASQEKLTAAREAWEDAQGFIIGNAKEYGAVQVQAIKDQAARYAKQERSVLGGQVSENSEASWRELNSGFINASNLATETRASEEYNRAQANRNYAQSGKSGKK